MANILILGAGTMGTAFSFPCSDNNHDVSIIGTHLENDFIDKINLSKKHPSLNCNIPKGVKFLNFEKFNEEINKEIKYSRTLEAEYISRTINKRTKKYKTLIILSSRLHFKGK